MRIRLASVIGAACALLAVLPAASAPAAGRCGDHPWCDASLSPQQRTGLLLAALTLDEKLGLMAGDDPFGVLTGTPATGTSNGVPRLDLPPIYFSDGPVGPREGRATAMPAPISLAATFDSAVARRIGAAVGEEVRHKGNDVVHAPTVDIMRTPLAGRAFEGYGEDPYLSSRLAIGWIEGVQREGVIANVKHYAPNSQEGTDPAVKPVIAINGGRFFVNDVVDERTLREIYLPPFEAAIRDAHAGTVMCAYNLLDGVPACQSHELLTRILREEWGFDGFVVSDYVGATKSTIDSVNNGLNIDLPLGFLMTPALVRANMITGQITERTVDRRVGEILRTMFRFGMFDRPAYPSDNAFDAPAHDEAALESEEQGIVLLKNENGLLPLNPGGTGAVAVIGEAAGRFLSGGGSSAVKPTSIVTPRKALERRLGADRVRFDPGTDPARAAVLAKGAETAIVFANDESSEGVDKACPRLSCAGGKVDQDAVVAAVAAANPRTIVVLETGAPVLTPWAGSVPAVLEAWYPGQAGGEAIARVLFGDSDPGGRLPATFPAGSGDYPTAGKPEQYPGVLNRAEFSEGLLVGYRHYDTRKIEPRWPFGHGLSYAAFAYGRPRLRALSGADDVLARISIPVRNASKRTGIEVVQLYAGLPEPSAAVPQPPKALKGVRKLTLAAGQRRRVSFRLTRRALSYWDTPSRSWKVAPGCYRLMLGRSSRDIRGTAELSVDAAGRASTGC